MLRIYGCMFSFFSFFLLFSTLKKRTICHHCRQHLSLPFHALVSFAFFFFYFGPHLKKTPPHSWNHKNEKKRKRPKGEKKILRVVNGRPFFPFRFLRLPSLSCTVGHVASTTLYSAQEKKKDPALQRYIDIHIDR